MLGEGEETCWEVVQNLVDKKIKISTPANFEPAVKGGNIRLHFEEYVHFSTAGSKFAGVVHFAGAQFARKTLFATLKSQLLH